MKPQKKAVVAKKATKMPTIAKKRRTVLEKSIPDIRKEKKSKKQEKVEEPKKKMEGERKKVEKPEEKKKSEEKKKAEEKKKLEKVEEKKKGGKEHEKKVDKTEEKKGDGATDKMEKEDCNVSDNTEKKKALKVDEKAKPEKIVNDPKKKIEKTDEKKKSNKMEEEVPDDVVKQFNNTAEKNTIEEKEVSINLSGKKKSKDEKKKEVKLIKIEGKDGSKSPTIKEKEKKVDRKKEKPDKEGNGKSSLAKAKKDSKPKQQAQKKAVTKKTVLAKKPNLPVVKKLVDKKIKLVKPIKEDDTLSSEEEDGGKKKKKNNSVSKSKVLQEKKPKLAKPMKAKIAQKHTKVTAVLAKNDKLKQLAQKMVVKKKIEVKDTEKLAGDSKKMINKDETSNETGTNTIKSEPTDEKEPERYKEEEPQQKPQDLKKPLKSAPKLGKKVPKKSSKPGKPQNESNNQKPSLPPENVPPEESDEPSKVCEDVAKPAVTSPEEPIAADNVIELNLKMETVNGESTGSASTTSDSEDEPEEDGKRNKSRETRKKERSKSPSDERARRMRLFGFWSGPKRHRVASLNALAKVHCLYENETGGVYLGGFCKPKPEKEKQKKSKEDKEEQQQQQQQPRKEKEKDKEKKVESKTEENIPKRKLRNVPGLRGKHWDMLESSSSPSSSDEESEREKNVERGKKRITKRRKRNEEVMDLKDMVVCKRMASLNATAILAASYSDEKNRRGSSSSSSTTCESSSDSEVEIIKRRKQIDSDLDRKKLRQGSDPEEVIKPSKKVVIVNQDTDVTITGVYVNQTRSTHHEGFCSIAGMQYRISSTSHTQTAATAVATELHDQQKSEQPCKSYTPLGALSSMQPPGSQGNHPNMSPRRHSAFSAPHQHGYYQPAGPLIQHPPTLPPIKGPPPEPTPTPPQNSEGSDDLVANSTTSGGTSNTGGGGFYRAYCPQYYGTPPQYQDLCYPPTYSHPHAHPPPYYKYAPAYRRQYYGYQESGGGGGPAGGGGTGGAPPPGVGVGVGIVEYQPPPPPPPGEYPLPYYPGYPPPPPPPAPNPAYLHTQGRPFVDHAAFQGCPCPMQSCPKNVDTGPLIGNGKGAPVVSGPGLSLPPSALVGPPSPARGLAGLAPPHGANAWDTDRVQLNTHRNLDQNQSSVQPASRNLVGGHNRPQNHRADCRTKDEKSRTAEEKLGKCGCQKHACTSASCEVKMETLSPGEKLTAVTNCPSSKYHDFKLENNNVKCESCSVEIGENISNCAANCNVKCESDFKCDIIKCEQCVKEGQMAILQDSHFDKDSGILSIDDKLEADTDVKEELNEGITIDGENWKKPDYEPTVQETVLEENAAQVAEERPKCQKLTKRKLSLDSLSDSRKKRKLGKRTLSVGSSQDLMSSEQSASIEELSQSRVDNAASADECAQAKKKQQQQTKKESQGQKRKLENASNPGDAAPKKMKSSKGTLNGIANCFKPAASETSIMETINDVIQQSLQMTKKKDRTSKTGEKTEKKKEKKSVNLLTTIKKVSKKVNAVKDLAAEKLSKIVAKSSQTKSKPESKTKSKSQENKLKAKSKCKQQDSKVEKIDGKAKTQDAKLKIPDPKPKVQDSKTKAQDSKPKAQDSKVKDVGKKQEVMQKTKTTNDVAEDLKCKKKRKNAKKGGSKKITGGCKVNDSPVANEGLMLPRKSFLKPKWSNGWSWEGESFEAKVYLTNEESAIRRCYASMKHESGDVLRPRDCVLLKSGPRKADLPFVAKIAALWENPDDGEMMFSLLWYYRPEHTEQGRTQYDTEDEVFASRHRDANSVACIEDKCYILTFNEYCRYRKNLRRIEEGLESPGLIVPPGDQVYPRENRQPPIPVSSDMVLFCRRVYDYRGKKLVKNPG